MAPTLQLSQAASRAFAIDRETETKFFVDAPKVLVDSNSSVLNPVVADTAVPPASGGSAPLLMSATGAAVPLSELTQSDSNAASRPATMQEEPTDAPAKKPRKGSKAAMEQAEAKKKAAEAKKQAAAAKKCEAEATREAKAAQRVCGFSEPACTAHLSHLSHLISFVCGWSYCAGHQG